LEKQFIKDGIPYEREKLLHIYFDGEKLKKHFKADYLCFNEVVVELKATPFLYKSDEEQLLNYLKATKTVLGLLVCFGSKSLTYKRLLNSF